MTAKISPGDHRCRDGVVRQVSPSSSPMYPWAVAESGRIVATVDESGRQAIAFGFSSPYDILINSKGVLR